MKIFPRFYVRRLYRVYKLSDVLRVLDPWIDDVLYPESPFLRQVASYLLRRQGGSRAPRFFKTVLAGEIWRLNEYEDLRASVQLAIVEAHRKYNPSKGKVDLVNWLSWNVPYEISKFIVWRIVAPIGPFSEAYTPSEIPLFEGISATERKIGILSEDLGLDRQTKYYYICRTERDLECDISRTRLGE